MKLRMFYIFEKQTVSNSVCSSLDPITIGDKRYHADNIKIIGSQGYDLRF